MLKRVCLAFVSVLCASTMAFAGGSKTETVIYVSCPCSITNADGIITDGLRAGLLPSPTGEGMAHGEYANPSISELDKCIIEEGRVVEGCYRAKMRAQGTCQENAKAQGDFATGMADYSACYGSVEMVVTDEETGEKRNVRIR